MRLTQTLIRLRDMTKSLVVSKINFAAAKRYRYAAIKNIFQQQTSMPFSRSRVTLHQVFLAKVIGIGLGILLGIALSIRFGSIHSMRMNADSMYSLAPMYGQMRMPVSNTSSSTETIQATASTTSARIRTRMQRRTTRRR